MSNDQKEHITERLLDEAAQLLEKMDKQSSYDARKHQLAFALACAHFEAAWEVWNENFDTMRAMVERCPSAKTIPRPPPPRPPGFGSCPHRVRQCWWCGATK